MSGVGGDPRNFQEFITDTRKRIVALERRQSRTTTTSDGGGGTVASDVQPGMLQPYVGGAIPSGWLLCDGTSVSRSVYSALFAVIGTTFGSGDGTTFGLPDLRGRSLVGLSAAITDFNAIGKTGGEKDHTLTASEVPNLRIQTVGGLSVRLTSGQYEINGLGSGAHRIAFNNNDEAAGPQTDSYLRTGGGAGGAHNNMSPYMVVNWLISAGSGESYVPPVDTGWIPVSTFGTGYSARAGYEPHMRVHDNVLYGKGLVNVGTVSTTDNSLICEIPIAGVNFQPKRHLVTNSNNAFASFGLSATQVIRSGTTAYVSWIALDSISEVIGN